MNGLIFYKIKNVQKLNQVQCCIVECFVSTKCLVKHVGIKQKLIEIKIYKLRKIMQLISINSNA